MTPQRALQRVVSGIRMVNPPFPIKLTTHSDGVGPVLCITVTVRHRITGEPLALEHRRAVPDGVELLDWIHTCLRDVFVHELDEAFHFNGVRVREPHPGVPLDATYDSRPLYESLR